MLYVIVAFKPLALNDSSGLYSFFVKLPLAVTLVTFNLSVAAGVYSTVALFLSNEIISSVRVIAVPLTVTLLPALNSASSAAFTVTFALYTLLASNLPFGVNAFVVVSHATVAEVPAFSPDAVPLVLGATPTIGSVTETVTSPTYFVVSCVGVGLGVSSAGTLIVVSPEAFINAS